MVFSELFFRLCDLVHSVKSEVNLGWKSKGTRGTIHVHPLPSRGYIQALAGMLHGLFYPGV